MFPEITPSAISKKQLSGVISVSYDGGYEQTRERYTRNRLEIEATYNNITKDKKDALKAHYDGVRQSMPFEWYDVDDNQTYTVRYAEPIQFVAKADTPNRYSITIKMRTI